MSDKLTTAEANELAGELKAIHSAMTERLETIEKTVDEATQVVKSDELDRMHARMDEIETKLSRPGAGGGNDEGADEQRAAFVDFLRQGPTPENRKALSRGDNAAAGYAVPEGIAKELVANLVEVSDVRAIAGQVTLTEGDAYPYLRRTGEAAASWVGELETRAETTNPAFGKGRIPVHENYLLIDISRQLIDMSGFDLEAEWMNEAKEQAALLEGAAFCSGDGSKKPVGIFHANGGLQTDYVASGNASTLSADVLLGMPTQLKAGYLANARWLFERATLRAIRQMKDGNGAYLWTAGYGTALANGTPPMIAGHPYTLAEDAPTIGTNTYPIAFGDFKQGYKVVDVTKMHQIRDEVTQATSGYVRHIVTRYTGGGVVKTEAIKLIKCAAS